MSDDRAVLAAEIYNWPSKRELAKLFRSEGYAVTEGNYSVRLDDFDHFVFRELGGDLSTGCITADHNSTEELIAVCRRVSQTLAKASVTHRFEVYSETGELAAYCHYEWPRDW